MRIYEGAPRQNYEEVFRSMGALIDQRGMREITLNETNDGFVVQGLAIVPGEDRPWDDPAARLAKETFMLREDDLARFMEEAVARRQERRPQKAPPPGQPGAVPAGAGFYEASLRALGSYIDQQQPRDVFFFEQDQQFVVRLLMHTRAGLRHVLVEFTREEIGSMIATRQQQRGF